MRAAEKTGDHQTERPSFAAQSEERARKTADEMEDEFCEQHGFAER